MAKMAAQRSPIARSKHVAQRNNPTSRRPHTAAHHKVHKSTNKNKQCATTTGSWADRRTATLSSQARQKLLRMRARHHASSAASQQGTILHRPGSETPRAGWNSLPAEIRNMIYTNALVIPGTEKGHREFDGTIDLRCGLLRLDRRAHQDTRSILAGATHFTVCGVRWREQMQGVNLDTLKDLAVIWSTGPWEELKALATHLADAPTLERLALHFPFRLIEERGTREEAQEVAAALEPWALAVQKRAEASGGERKITQMMRNRWGALWTQEFSMSAVNLLQFEVSEGAFDVYHGRKWCRAIQRKLQAVFPVDGGIRFQLDCKDGPIGGWPKPWP